MKILQGAAQARPVKAAAGVMLAAWGNMLVACHGADGAGSSQRAAQGGQRGVLGVFKQAAFQPFQLDADGVVVAVGAALVAGSACMPGARLHGGELPEFARAADVEVGRHLQAAYLAEPGVDVPVQRIGEQALHFVAAVLAGRQADGVDDDEVDHHARRTRANVGRGAAARAS